MKSLILVTLLCFSSLLFTTCHKDSLPFYHCKEKNTIKLPQLAKDYFFFQTGSWWVYECEQTGEHDSVYISKSEHSSEKDANSKRDCNCGWGKCFEYSLIEFNSTLAQSQGKIGFITYLMAFSNWDYESKNLLAEVRESYDLNDIYSGYKFTFKEQKNFQIESTIGGEVKLLDTITLNNVKYKDVLKYSKTKDWSVTAYYGKNLHLIQYQNSSDAKIWNLIKYHVIQYW